MPMAVYLGRAAYSGGQNRTAAARRQPSLSPHLIAHQLMNTTLQFVVATAALQELHDVVEVVRRTAVVLSRC